MATEDSQRAEPAPQSHDITARTECSNPARSAKTPSRDILFPLLIRGRKPAECGHYWQFVRTMSDLLEGPLRPFFVSLGPLSPTQPNHGHFGTDVGIAITQWVGGRPKGCGFEKLPLGRSEPGSNHSVQCVCFRPHSGPLMGRLQPAGRDSARTFGWLLGSSRVSNRRSSCRPGAEAG